MAWICSWQILPTLSAIIDHLKVIIAWKVSGGQMQALMANGDCCVLSAMNSWTKSTDKFVSNWWDAISYPFGGRLRSSSLAMRQSPCAAAAIYTVTNFPIFSQKIFFLEIFRFDSLWKNGREIWLQKMIDLDAKCTVCKCHIWRKANALSRAQIQFIDTWRVGKPTRKEKKKE